MQRRTRAALTILTASLTGCASANPPIDLPAKMSEGVWVKYQRELFDFRLTGVKHFPPASDVMLRYSTPDKLIADVFLYAPPSKWAKCDTQSCADSAAAYDAAKFVEIIPMMIRNHWVRSAHVIEARTLTPSPESKWKAGRFIEMALVTSEGNKEGEFYVYYLPNLYVKVRSDFAPDSAQRERVRKFSELFADLLEYLPPPGTRTALANVQR